MKQCTWTPKVASLLVPFFLAAYPSMALANGGPVEWTQGTPQGGLSLKQEAAIRLVSEDLFIKLDQDLNHYEVRAIYMLDNPGQKAKVLVGVPMQWAGRRTASIVAKDISFELMGKHFGCEAAQVKQRPIDSDAETGPESVPSGNAWCVGKLLIPRAPEVPLTLTYRGELQFEDRVYTSSAFKVFGHRTLRYPLSPAGYWAGKVEHIFITIALGPYRAYNLINRPKGARVFDSRIEWQIHDVDLKHALDLVIELDGGAKLSTKEIATWNAQAPKYARVPLNARVSSTLRGETSRFFNEENLVDGNPATAWCSSGPGDNEWVEISVPRSEGYRLKPKYSFVSGQESRTELEAVAIIPGFAKDAATFRRYRRPRKLVISRCRGAPYNLLGELDFDSAAAYDESGTILPKDTRNRKDGQWAVRSSLFSDVVDGREPCLRFTIRSTIPGRSPHTCISEIAFILNGG